ncbi:hypothetical protein V8F20_011850 [Naviculisporaceae sp. PSN 640]
MSGSSDLFGDLLGTPSNQPTGQGFLGSSPQQKKQYQQEVADQEKKAAENESEERELEITTALSRLENAYNTKNDNPDEVTYDIHDLRMILDDNKRLRQQVANLDATKPRTMTHDQIEHMKTQLRHLKEAHVKYVEDRYKHQDPNAAAVPPLPSVMSQEYHFRFSNPRAKSFFNELKRRIHALIVNNINLETARTKFKTVDDNGMGPLPGMEYVCKDTRPFVTGSSREYHVVPLLEGYIWWRLQRYIFDAPLNDWNSRPYAKQSAGGPTPGAQVPTLWSTGFGPAFFCYFQEIRDPVLKVWPEMLGQLNELRARVATFLDRLHGDPDWDVQVQAIDDIFGKNLMDFVAPEMYGQYLRGALEVVDASLQLDRMFRRSVGDWRMGPSMQEREDFMEKTTTLMKPGTMTLAGKAGTVPGTDSSPAVKHTKVQNTPEYRITVIVSPMLLKRGNDVGRDYTTLKCVAQATVVTDPDLYEPEEEAVAQ